MIWVVVTGSRDHDKRDAIWKKLDEVADRYGREYMVVVTGDCPKGGADLHAINWAKKNFVPYFNWPAAFPILGRSAGPIRNRKMLEWVAMQKNRTVLAFPRGESLGTRGAVKIANELDIYVDEVEYEDL